MKAACKCDPNRHQQKYRVEQNHSGYCDIAEQDLTFALQGTCFSEHDFSSSTPRIYKGFLLIQTAVLHIVMYGLFSLGQRIVNGHAVKEYIFTGGL